MNIGLRDMYTLWIKDVDRCSMKLQEVECKIIQISLAMCIQHVVHIVEYV